MIEPTNILFLDIETVPQVYDWQDLDPRAQELWSQKMRFKIESRSSTAEEIYTEAGIYAEFGKIVCISVGFIHGRSPDLKFKCKTFSGDDEIAVLEQFTQLCNEHFNGDEYYLCGHNGKEFDFPYIARRCVINNLPLPEPLDIAGRKPWEVKHLDTMNLWKFGDYKHYTSLDLLTHILKVPSPKSDISGADVARVYYEDNDLKRIVDYCQRDVLATAQVFLKLQGMNLIKEDNVQFLG